MNRRYYNLVGNSRINDIKKNRYDKANHITAKYLRQLKQDTGEKCYYCKCELDWTNQVHIRRKDQVTLQRKDNRLGHIKGNCVYACFNCNVVLRRENTELILARFNKDRLYSYNEIRTILYESKNADN